MFAKELIKKIRRIEITTRKVVNQTLAGQYHSVFKGRGMAFSEVRLYQPGDEIRTIDWNVTARMQDTYVKVFTEERELTVMILVDLSGSQDFGTRDKTKGEIAAELAAMLAFSAISNNDRVGLICFTDRIERFVAPKKGRKHALRVISEILSFRPQGKGTDLSQALSYLMRVGKRRAVAFLISDFLLDRQGEDAVSRERRRQAFERSLKIASRRHDLVPVALRDPLEEQLPRLGLAWIEDPETLERFQVDASRPEVLRAFARAVQAQREERKRMFARLRMDHVEVRAGDAYAKALVAFFRARARRMAV